MHIAVGNNVAWHALASDVHQQDSVYRYGAAWIGRIASAVKVSICTNFKFKLELASWTVPGHKYCPRT